MRELVERIEAADGPSFALDVEIAEACGVVERWTRFKGVEMCVTSRAPRPFTASLDAALTLLPEQSEWSLHSPDTDAGETKFGAEICPTADGWKAGRSAQCAYASTPALALVAAILRALASRK